MQATRALLTMAPQPETANPFQPGFKSPEALKEQEGKSGKSDMHSNVHTRKIFPLMRYFTANPKPLTLNLETTVDTVVVMGKVCKEQDSPTWKLAVYEPCCWQRGCMQLAAFPWRSGLCNAMASMGT